MKIYTKVVWDFQGRVIEEEGYEYHGPIAEAKGTVTFPPPTKEERALQSEQVASLRFERDRLAEALRQQDLLAPLLFETAGIEAVRDQAGKIVSFNRIARPSEAQAERIQGLLLERSEKALKGELPVSPGLTRELDEQETNLRSFLTRRFGPDYETSTPGIEALANFKQRKAEILDASQRGEITMAEGLSLARQGGQERTEQLAFERVSGLPFQSISGSRAVGAAAQGFNAPLSFMRGEREGEFQAAQQTAANKLASMGSWLGAAGTVAGVGAGIGFSKFLFPKLGGGGSSFLSFSRNGAR